MVSLSRRGAIDALSRTIFGLQHGAPRPRKFYPCSSSQAWFTVDCGSATQIVLVVNIRFAAAHEKGAINSPYAVAMNALVTGSLIPLIGIYPTALVVLVTLKKTHSGRKFTYDSKPVPTVPAIPLRRVAVTTYEEEVRTQPESPFLVIGRNFDSAELSGDEEGYESREKEADAMLA